MDSGDESEVCPTHAFIRYPGDISAFQGLFGSSPMRQGWNLTDLGPLSPAFPSGHERACDGSWSFSNLRLTHHELGPTSTAHPEGRRARPERARADLSAAAHDQPSHPCLPDPFRRQIRDVVRFD